VGFLQKILRGFAKGRRDPWHEKYDIEKRQEKLQQMKLSKKLQANIDLIEKITGSSSDLIIRKFRIGATVDAAIVCLDGMIKEAVIDEMLHSLIVESIRDRWLRKLDISAANVLNDLLPVHDVVEADNLADLFDHISIGDTCVLIDGQSTALLCDSKGKTSRAISEPATEQTLRGPRDSFVEDLRTNTSLIRHRIRVPHLWFEEIQIGRLTRTKVEMVYIKGLANEGLIKEVRDRLNRIDTGSILESGFIEEFIEDQPLSIFPTVMETERPDKVCACLVEGRVAILTQGTPYALLVPTELVMMLQSPDDYYEKFPLAAFTRIMRIGAFLTAMMVPGLYVAVVTFHPELMPTNLLIRIAAAREGVPFPVLVEVLILDGLFELLREAGVRLPMAIGQALSIVGALIIGDAAIRAGIVAPSVVIVIALTAIASFVTPIFSLGIAVRLVRFIFTIAGAVLGIFGIQFVLLLLAVHLCSLRSFGVPYLTPVAPFVLRDMKDNILRLWHWKLPTRPKFLGQRDVQREDPSYSVRPDPSQRSREGG